MLDFFNKLFKPAPPSGATAKERLRLVLLSDHLSLAPDVIEALKRDLLGVISRYVEIDQAHADVTFEHREGEVAMLASIPITGMRERRRDDPPVPPSAPESPVTPKPAPALSTRATPGANAASAADAPSAADAQLTAIAAEAAPPPVSRPPRRRRKRKASAAKRAAQQSMTLGNPAQA